MNKRWLWVSLIFITIICFICTFFQFQKKYEYTRFTRPDFKYSVVVYKNSQLSSIFNFKMPGQSGDSPGVVMLIDQNNNILHEKDVAMVQLIENVEWNDGYVYIKLFAEWKLP